MSTNLKRLGEKARKEPKLVFTSLYHHVTDIDNLRSCYDELDGTKAVGVDGVTKGTYGKRLDKNLQDLSERVKQMGYKPQPKRRSYVPKSGSAKGRPLGISCFEDKLVELAVKRVLEPIYETQFEDSSFGYRPRRSQHDCLDALGGTIQQQRVSHIVEADISGFFDNVNHDWMLKFLRHRIGDTRMLRLVFRMLKAGILEDGLLSAGTKGTPQGSILSPLLSNIYLHYTLDLWFRVLVKPRCAGEAYYFRFADDFLACFQYKADAEDFEKGLRIRLQKFHLSLAEEKTQCIAFGRFSRINARKRGTKPAEFTFLGFTHYSGKTRDGRFKVKRRTSKKKYRLGLRNFTTWARGTRHKLTKGEMLRGAKSIIAGHLNYYAITDNLESCSDYVYHVERILFKWLNRKSQRRAYTWDSFREACRWLGWPRPKIHKDLSPFRRAEAFLMLI